MTEASLLVLGWLVRVALGASLLLLLTCLLVALVRQPARRQRLAECGVLAALWLAGLCLAPTWLPVQVPEPLRPAICQPSVAARVPADDVQPEPPLPEPLPDGAMVGVPLPDVAVSGASADSPPSPTPAIAETPVTRVDWSMYLFPAVAGLSLAGSVCFLVRLGWGYWRLRRFLATAQHAPPAVARLFGELSDEADRTRLLVSDRLSVPLSCGLFRP